MQNGSLAVPQLTQSYQYDPATPLLGIYVSSSMQETALSRRALLMAQMVKNLPVILETWAQSLGQEDPLEKGMGTHSSILAWRIPWTEAPFLVTLAKPSVQFSRSVMSNSWRPHESQHTRPPCPSPTPGVHSDSRPSSQ